VRWGATWKGPSLLGDIVHTLKLILWVRLTADIQKLSEGTSCCGETMNIGGQLVEKLLSGANRPVK
jgi:hypothetical protein